MKKLNRWSKDAILDLEVSKALDRRDNMASDSKFAEALRQAIVDGLESNKPTAVSTVAGTKLPHFISKIQAARATSK